MANWWPVSFPGSDWVDAKEERAVLDVLRHGSLFRYYGPRKPKHVTALETAARKLYGVKYVQATSSGTGALMTAMSALGIGPGAEVIIPTFLWVSTASAVVHANAIPVLCEVDDSLTMDPADLERKITPRTRLVVPVHMTGAPCDMKRIMAIARKHNLPVLEDCAQANGGSFNGKKLGTFGAVGMFSFQINKNVTAGEGGLLVTNDAKLYARLNAAHDVGLPWVSGAPTGGSGDALWGQGRRMCELVGAVAAVQIRKLPSVVRHMHASKRRIKAMLKDVPNLRFRRLNDEAGDSASFLAIILNDPKQAAAAVATMREKGLHSVCRLADYGMHIYSNIAALVNKVPLSPAGNPWSLAENRGSVHEYARGACPQSDELFDRSVIMSIPSRLTREQERRAAEVIRQAVEG